ncbi:hypothetical protein H696_03030 [Fonticula alba]|uniref:MIP18 family-like domain-containing protein n=1 Tax=Fonticula alba TaxID=691883 RepID=A0A058Z8T0_FONAL|nr:hypothetical protein H696_03030 [Fonticula alba]KCV70675.1 hypothetical protein H696_03030 [Fonticula alba]|eukprot:XP_009495191.1 hypothetical protein H696_03030 [Fonticula alba]
MAPDNANPLVYEEEEVGHTWVPGDLTPYLLTACSGQAAPSSQEVLAAGRRSHAVRQLTAAALKSTSATIGSSSSHSGLLEAACQDHFTPVLFSHAPDLLFGEGFDGPGGVVEEMSPSTDFPDVEPIDPDEIYGLIQGISDPEHPLSLGQLRVVQRGDIWVGDRAPAASPTGQDGSSSDGAAGADGAIDSPWSGALLPPCEGAAIDIRPGDLLAQGGAHGLSLLSPVESPGIDVTIHLTPTIPHCSLAALIGLCVRARLDRALPSQYNVSVSIAPGAHSSEAALNRQLSDKERRTAAVENARLAATIDSCLSSCEN